MAIGLRTLVWFLLLLTSQPGTVQGKVVTDFQECNSFFKDGIPPQGFNNLQNVVKICQNYRNRYYFATLYRTDLRIPVYSAYKYERNSNMVKVQRPCSWFYEPQIDNRTARPEMRCSLNKISEKQAVDADYNKSIYERGHLYPFTFIEHSQTVTCTLTNAIPMTPADNKKWFSSTEKKIKKLAEICDNTGKEMYVVTGSANYTRIKINNKVVVPGLIWSAACCTSGKLNVLSSTPVTPVNTSLEFSVAYIKELLSGKNSIKIRVRQLQSILNATIFDQCRGTSQNDEEVNDQVVETLLNEQPGAGSKRKKQKLQNNQRNVNPRKLGRKTGHK